MDFKFLIYGSMRGMKISSSSASKLPKEEEESGDDKDERGETESASIVRPKSAKRGPFDFDGTRVVQELNNEHTV